MKKFMKIFVLIIMVSFFAGCNNKYIGYWCKYDETATIVVLLNKDNNEDQRKKIEDTVNKYENLESLNYYSREDYAKELGGNVEDIDIYDTYVLLFDSMDSIGTYIDEINKLDGVKNATQSNAKTNLSLYNLKKNGKYEYTNSDEAEKKDIVKGKYKIKKGVITFTPENSNGKSTLLYIKNGHLCEDADCTNIYAESDKSCNSLK